MNTNINKAKELAKSFINELFKEKGNTDFSSYLCDDIIFTGFKDIKNNCGIKNFLKLDFLQTYNLDEDLYYNLSNVNGYEISSNTYNVIIEIYNLTTKSINQEISLCLSIIITDENNKLLIKCINTSILNKNIKSKKDNSFTDFGGTLQFNLSDNLEIIDISHDLMLIMGYKDKSFLYNHLNNNWINAIPVNDREKVLKNIKEGLSSKNHYIISHQLNCNNNTTINVTHEGRISNNKNGKVSILSYIINEGISAPVYHNQIQYIDRLESIINSYPDPIFFKNLDGKYLGLNQAFLKYFNLNNFLEVIGKTDYEIFDEQIANHILIEDQKALKSKGYFSKIYKSITKEETIQYSQFIKIPLKENNKIVGLIGYVNDLTELKTLNNQLENNEAEMEFVFNNTNSAYYIKDVNLKFKRVNLAFLKLFNLQKEDVIGKKSCDIEGINNILIDRDSIEEEILTNKHSQKDTLSFTQKDNKKTFLSLYENVLIDNNKEVKGIICSIDDISESKSKEIELQKKYDYTINNINGESFYAYSKLDIDTKSIVEIKSCKPFLNNMKIDDYDEFLEVITNQLLYNEEKEEFAEFFNFENLIQISEKQDIPTFKFTFRGDKRPIAVIRFSLYTLINPKNKHRELVVIAKDITEELDLKTLVNTITSSEYDFIAKVDLMIDNCSFISINNNIDDFNFLSSEKQYKVDQFIDILLEDTTQKGKEKEAIAFLESFKNSSHQQNRFYLDLVKGKRKSIIIKEIEKGIFFILCSDITTITKKATSIKNKLAESMKKAQEANNIKSKFLASMSHDMRTPLNGIIGLSNFGIEESNNLILTDYFSKIKISSLFLLTLLNDVLDMQSIELGKIKIKKVSIDIDKNIEEIISMVKSRADEKNITLTIKKDNYPRFVQTDPIRFNQILINLLSNAIKYTQKNGRVNFTINYINKELPYFEFIIQDNGFGMSEKFQEHMFEQFSVELNKNSSIEGGSGLGLTIAKNLTELLDGTIMCKSKLNVGSTFIVKLPLAKVDSLVDITICNKNKLDASSKLLGKKILICEDNYLNIVIIEKLLHKENILTDTAENGKICIQKMKDSHYDAILMDIRMPVMGGIEAAKNIRKFNTEIPIIALSANAYKEDIEISLSAGMNAHLSKPIDVNKLFTTLRAFIK